MQFKWFQLTVGLILVAAYGIRTIHFTTEWKATKERVLGKDGTSYGGNRNADITRKYLPYVQATDRTEMHQLRHPNNTFDDRSNQKSCHCVRCKEDPFCGGLWQGNQAYGDRIGGSATATSTIYDIPIHVVVSYCKGDLDYISAVTDGYNIASIHVISKCQSKVSGVPNGTTVEVLGNVGRCDHSYAHYINDVLDSKLGGNKNNDDNKKSKNKDGDHDALVVFLKDNAGARNLHQAGLWNSFSNMVEVASSQAGFACGMLPLYIFETKPILWLSAQFEVESLRQFTIKEYGSISKYDDDKIEFLSAYPNWGNFYDHLGVENGQREIVQVCYGGVFATSVKQIKKQSAKVWKRLEESLKRGDNIQEGHYAERMWGMLLASPLEQYQIDAIKNYTNAILRPGYRQTYRVTSEAVVGAMVRKMKEKSKAKYRQKRVKCNSARHCWKK